MQILNDSFFSRMHAIHFSVCLLSVVLFLGCTNHRRLSNEDNSFYKRGMRLQLDGQYEDAIDAFKQCLHFSPDSYKANLQLAVIYEDHKYDYPLAIVHYNSYLKKAPDTEDIEIAQQWLGRAEKKYFEELRFIYGNPILGRNEKLDPARGKHSQIDHSLKNDTLPVTIKSGDFTQPISEIPKQPSTIASTNKKALAGDKEFGGDSPSTSKEHHTGITNPIILDEKNAQNDQIRQNYYIVQKGDTLVSIAEELLGDENSWRDLYEINKDKVKSPELLQIGQELKIPPLVDR